MKQGEQFLSSVQKIKHTILQNYNLLFSDVKYIYRLWLRCNIHLIYYNL